MHYQLGLKIVFNVVDQEMHDGLRDAILNAFANDVEVGLDQTLCYLGQNINNSMHAL